MFPSRRRSQRLSWGFLRKFTAAVKSEYIILPAGYDCAYLRHGERRDNGRRALARHKLRQQRVEIFSVRAVVKRRLAEKRIFYKSGSGRAIAPQIRGEGLFIYIMNLLFRINVPIRENR
jgi:hypothetical protein